MRAMTTRTVLIGATFVSGWAKPLYQQVANIWDARIMMLPLAGWPRLSQTQQQVARQLDKWLPGREPVALIGHSQGGLHACLYAASRPWVNLVVTANTPHHGSTTARSLSWCWPSLDDMLPRSTFMRFYIADCLPQVVSRLASVFSHDDPLVQPGDTAYVPGARNYVITRRGPRAVMGELTPTAKSLHRRSWLSTGGNHLTGLFDRAAWLHLRQDLVEGAA